jgi:hypothetical protein
MYLQQNKIGHRICIGQSLRPVSECDWTLFKEDNIIS